MVKEIPNQVWSDECGDLFVVITMTTRCRPGAGLPQIFYSSFPTPYVILNLIQDLPVRASVWRFQIKSGVTGNG